MLDYGYEPWNTDSASSLFRAHAKDAPEDFQNPAAFPQGGSRRGQGSISRCRLRPEKMAEHAWIQDKRRSARGIASREKMSINAGKVTL